HCWRGESGARQSIFAVPQTRSHVRVGQGEGEKGDKGIGLVGIDGPRVVLWGKCNAGTDVKKIKNRYCKESLKGVAFWGKLAQHTSWDSDVRRWLHVIHVRYICTNVRTSKAATVR